MSTPVRCIYGNIVMYIGGSVPWSGAHMIEFGHGIQMRCRGAYVLSFCIIVGHCITWTKDVNVKLS